MGGFGAKEWNEHAALVGQVTLAWNGCVHQLLRVFTHLTGIEPPVADAIFFSPQSDSSQRRLIERVSVAVDLAEPHRASLKRLLGRLDKVATKRNLAAHTIFGISAYNPATGVWAPTIVPALQHPQDTRLRDDFSSQFREAEETLSKIHQDLEHWLAHTPFPDRPWPGPPMPIAAAQELERLAAGTASLEDPTTASTV